MPFTDILKKKKKKKIFSVFVHQIILMDHHLTNIGKDVHGGYLYEIPIYMNTVNQKRQN